MSAKKSITQISTWNGLLPFQAIHYYEPRFVKQKSILLLINYFIGNYFINFIGKCGYSRFYARLENIRRYFFFNFFFDFFSYCLLYFNFFHINLHFIGYIFKIQPTRSGHTFNTSQSPENLSFCKWKSSNSHLTTKFAIDFIIFP